MIARLWGRRRAAAPAPQAAPAPRPVDGNSAIAQADKANAAMVSLRRAIGRASRGEEVDAEGMRRDAAAVLFHARHAYGLHAGEEQSRADLRDAAFPDDLTGGA